MAVGDVTVFEEAKAVMLDGNWASTDNFYLALVSSGVTPTAADATPTWGDYSGSEVTAAGTYTANGTVLGSLATLVAEAGGTMTFDSATNPSWAQDASNGADARWGIIYNFTDAGKDALAFVDLGAVIDMTAGDLTITWNDSGIFTIT